MHVECLNIWRNTSANPKSFFQCDQCLFEYKFGRAFEAYGRSVDRFTFARFLGSSFAIYAVSGFILSGIVFFAGFVGKMFSPGASWYEASNHEELFCFLLLLFILSLVFVLQVGGFFVFQLGTYGRRIILDCFFKHTN